MGNLFSSPQMSYLADLVLLSNWVVALLAVREENTNRARSPGYCFLQPRQKLLYHTESTMIALRYTVRGPFDSLPVGGPI